MAAIELVVGFLLQAIPTTTAMTSASGSGGDDRSNESSILLPGRGNIDDERLWTVL